MKEPSAKYFVAVIPPQPLYDEVRKLKEHFRDVYGSSAAMRSPAHITLHMPFLWPDRKVPELLKLMEETSAGISETEVVLDGFGKFGDRVIFIRAESTDGLREIRDALVWNFRTKLNLFNADYKDLPFHPHMTVAFRDLKKPAFRDAWSKFRITKFTSVFPITAVCLLKHDGSAWKEWKFFSLKEN